MLAGSCQELAENFELCKNSNVSVTSCKGCLESLNEGACPRRNPNHTELLRSQSLLSTIIVTVTRNNTEHLWYSLFQLLWNVFALFCISNHSNQAGKNPRVTEKPRVWNWHECSISRSDLTKSFGAIMNDRYHDIYIKSTRFLLNWPMREKNNMIALYGIVSTNNQGILMTLITNQILWISAFQVMLQFALLQLYLLQ